MKYYQIVIIFIISFSTLNSQVYDFTKGTIEHEGAIVQSIQFNLDPKPDLLESKFQTWIDDNYNVDLDDKKLIFFDKDVLEAKGVTIPSVSKRQMDLYVRIDKNQSNASSMHIYASWGYNNWISEKHDPLVYSNLKNIAFEFIEEYLPEYYLNAVDNTREDLVDLIAETEQLEAEVEEQKLEIEKLIEENNEKMSLILMNKQKIYEAQKKLDIKIDKYNKVQDKINNK